jgi:hypothetical protein
MAYAIYIGNRKRPFDIVYNKRIAREEVAWLIHRLDLRKHPVRVVETQNGYTTKPKKI